MSLAAPLASLAAYPQFVAVRIVSDPARPGKTNKIPIDAKTLAPASVTDPTTWATYDQVAATGLPVGFVLTANDPFFCLDIDSALHSGQWSPLAMELCAAFPSAAVEVSTSGTGLHIWGTGVAPSHKCKNTELGIELYHADRFICLGDMTTATGNAWQDFTAHLQPVVGKYFTSSTGVGGDAGWTDMPRDDWCGSTDDADLIRRARESRSAGAVFGNKASFDDLWSGNVEVLRLAYPSQTDDYGRSEADRALAQHLAFWTGCDCERMLRLMRQSALVRDKWERDDYMQRTILSACGDCFDVCRDKGLTASELSQSITVTAPASADYTMPTGETRTAVPFVKAGDFGIVFGGCVYVESQNRAFVPGRTGLVKPEVFRVIFGGMQFCMDDVGEKFKGDAWEAFTQCPLYRPPRVGGTCFRPDLPHGAAIRVQGETFVNLFMPAEVDQTPGDVTPFLNHVAKLMPDQNDQEKLISYMAALVQYPGRKFAWAPLIQGAEGNGKTLFSLVVKEAVGAKYTSAPRADHIESQFNSWIADKIFVMVEDVMGGRSLMEILKPMITGESMSVELKGVDSETRPICANFILNTNHKDGLPKSANDRRIAPFFTAQQNASDLERDGLTGDYFPRLYNWLKCGGGYGAVTAFLKAYRIRDELNPATLAIRAPMTSSTAEAIQYGLGTVEQEIQEAVDQGRTGFKGDFISSHHLDLLLRESRRDIHRTKRRTIIEALGYIPHPALKDGRVNNMVMPDGCKPRLYVRRGSEVAQLTHPQEIARRYSESQMLVDAFATS